MSIKYKHLFLGLLLDGIGYASYLIPILGESIDFIWAPLSAFILMKMYKGPEGRAAGILEFFEEILPGTDFIPTYTIMWFYRYVIKKGVQNPIEMKTAKVHNS